MPSTKPPSGMRDFLPDALARRDYVLGKIREVYERHHFEEIETPAMERIETLTGKYGDEGDQLIFKVLKRAAKLETAVAALGDRPEGSAGLADMGLRYDLTVPLSRVVAQYRGVLPQVFKRFQLAPVWRADRPARGRFREFLQCDADIVGSESGLVEVEVLTAAAEALVSLGLEGFDFRINDRAILFAMTHHAGIESGGEEGALIALDKLDKIGVEGVRRDMSRRGLGSEGIDALFSLIESGGETADPIARLDRLESALGGDAPIDAIARLREILSLVSALVPGEANIVFDPSLARGLSYYTGPIFEFNVDDFPGSIGSGGRYDDLVGMFLGRRVPACGVSLGVDRLLVLMDERGMFAEQIGSRCDVYVANFPGVSPLAGLTLAKRLREKHLRVDVAPDSARMKKQFKLAQRMGADVVALIGPQEHADHTVVLKHMASGDQRTVPQDGAPDAVAELLARDPKRRS